MCIIDIMDKNGILLKWEKAKQKYDLNNSSCLSWLGLINQFQQYGNSILGIVSLVILQELIYRMTVWRVLALKWHIRNSYNLYQNHRHLNYISKKC